MPNWCNNNIKIEGPKDKIKNIWDTVQADPDKGFFTHLVPMPKELEGTTSPSSSAKKPQPMIEGFDNWYDWRVSNWGTKWDISTDDCGLQYREDGDTAFIEGWFDTAWAPPIDCLNTFIRKHNDIYVTNMYWEGGMDFAGIWTDGCDEEVNPSNYKSQDFLDADRDSVEGQLDEAFGIGECMAEYEAEEETEAETKVRELVVEKKAQNMEQKDKNAILS
tara:strand:+ start:2066 stop:2722 length:657 start_codon:yes stop_codon:yes gene_type:complete